MIITRAPVRISLLGGGTDFPSWFQQHGGVVVGGAIDKYSYVWVNGLAPYHPYKSRFVYSDIETVQKHADIDHRAIKACLRYMDMGDGPGVEIHHIADLPSRSGTGSSSTFVVGLLHALAAFNCKHLTPGELANAAYVVENKVMGECVGCQDQCWGAHGGFRIIRFHKDGTIGAYPVDIPAVQLADLQSRLVLAFTGISRTSSEVAKTYVPSLHEKVKEQMAMMRLAEEGIEAIYKADWEKLGRLLDNAWFIKRGLGEKVSSAAIDDLYATARVHGAIGGKITGAGGGGCLVLLMRDSSCRSGLERALTERGCTPIDFHFEHDGSQVIFAD